MSAGHEAPAATLTNYLNDPSGPRDWQQYSLAVNVGDTVVWVNPEPTTNYVASYGGEWKSPPLGPGDTFAFTFSDAGFYAYHTGATLEASFSALVSGAITVKAWTGAPPALTINTPVDGTVLRPMFAALLQASSTNNAELARIEYFANSASLGAASSPPYSIQWQPTNQGACLLLAKAVDRQGVATWSQPISVTVGPYRSVWGPRVLPTGEFVFFYNAIGGRPGSLLVSSDTAALRDPSNWVGSVVISAPGLFVDPRPLQGLQRQFYAVVRGPG